MSIKKSQSANIIGRLKRALKFTTNVELAEFLGVAPNTLSSWVKRGSVDYDLILAKCDSIDMNWLLLDNAPVTSVNQPLTGVTGHIPLLLAPVRAGEPMLASPEVAEMVDIGDIVHPAGSLLVRYTGNNLREYDINRGDLLTVATTATAERGDLVLATLADGSVEVMQYEQLGEQGYLYPPGGGARIVVTDDVVLRGVVTSAYRIIKRLL